MEIRYYKALWGMESLPVPEALRVIAENGYDGVAAALPLVREIQAVPHDLAVTTLLFAENVEDFQRDLNEAKALGADSINVHAGKDWWSFQQGCMFFEQALEIVEGSGLPVSFETHRGRLLFDPSSAAAYLRKFPGLRLTADFSHWTCVCESMLHDQAESLDLAVRHTGLLHARVGHEEGPQVPDPRSPQWAGHVERFLEIWDGIKSAAEARGESVLRVDPEFGPPNYLWTDPQDGRPLADLLAVCNWTRDTLRERWL